jgi:ATP-dependent helicase HrpB
LINISEHVPEQSGHYSHEMQIGSIDLEAAVCLWLLLAYPDRVVKRRGREGTGIIVGGRGVRLDNRSVVRNAEFFIAIDPHEDRRRGILELQVNIASSIERGWLESHHPELVHAKRTVTFNQQVGRVIAAIEYWYQDILVRQDTSVVIEPEEAAIAFASAVSPKAGVWFRTDPEASNWLARVSFLRRVLPECDLPDFDERTLASIVEELCRDWGMSRVEELERQNRTNALRGRLTRSQNQRLDLDAPSCLKLPSGRVATLTYEDNRPPVLGARIQELFGWTETPRVAQGRVPILLHLLAPNQRPVQITDDLRSFWTTTYFQVRKDLRGRYPKHNWHEDPLNARPGNRSGRG